MRCPRHDLAAGPDGKCVRCRREEEEAAPKAPDPHRRGIVALLALAGLCCAGVVVVALRPQAEGARARTEPQAPSLASAAPSAPPLAAMEAASVVADPRPAGVAPSSSTALDRAMHAVPIVLYCRPNVADCGRARVWLLDRHYVYKEHDVGAEPEAAAALRRFAPDGTVPAFDVDGQGFAGFDADRLQRALEYAGARRLQR